YLLQDGYADTFDELIRETEWDRYGTESGNPKCRNCMVHSGYEASAVNDTFSLTGIFRAARATVFGGTYKNPEAAKAIANTPRRHPGQLVPLNVKATKKEAELQSV